MTNGTSFNVLGESMTTWIGIILDVKRHAVDLSKLYLKEGATVLVSNEPGDVWGLYERNLPDEEYWAVYTANPNLESPESVPPHDIIHITRENGLCKIFFSPDDQEKECADRDHNIRALKKLFQEGKPCN